MCGKVGSDSFGDDYLQQLTNEGVDTTLMRRSITKPTGIASINVELSTGSNTIVVISGANDEVVIENNDELQLKDIDVATSIPSIEDYITRAKILICQNEIPHDTTLRALKIARKSSKTISILNPAPATKLCLDLIVESDIVCPNETELSALTDLPTTTDEEIIIAARYLLSSGGCEVIIATLCDRGEMVVTRDKTTMFKTKSVKAVDSTGAGDSFIGWLASTLEMYILR